MNRRQMLATGGTVMAWLVSGCSILSDEIVLRAERRDENNQVLIVFSDVEKVFQLTISRRPENRKYGQLFSLTTWQEQHLRLESFRFEIRAPATGEQPRVTPVLETPEGSAYQNLRFYRARDDSHTSVVEMRDTGGMGDGSISLDLVIVPDSGELPDELAVGIDAEISDGDRFGTEYLASERVIVELL